MKTVKEWLELMHSKREIVLVERAIVEIQLDAWRQGMTDAAEIVYNPLSDSHNPATAHDRFNAKKAILAALSARDEKGKA